MMQLAQDIYPVIKAGLPDQEITDLYDPHKYFANDAWLRIGPPVPLSTDVYSLSNPATFQPCQNLPIARIDVLHLYNLEAPDSHYPEDIKETPVVFAGRVIVGRELWSAAGILFRSGHRTGWVNVHPPYRYSDTA